MWLPAAPRRHCCGNARPMCCTNLPGRGGIRVRVQARPAATEPAKTPKKQLDEAAATSLEALASRLGDEPLAKALRRLARHAPRAKSDDDDQPLEGVKDQDPQQ